ncbi:MAG: HD domain-containing protein [Desulfobulbaceae bacterium]|nr:HD domain-containing protein [Desulfobulbaceae bacterium]
MLPNIRAHSLVVARIAEFLALALRQRGHEINVELTVAAALLHDIGKSFCLENDRDHAALGRDICLQHDLHELAPLVLQHVVLDAQSFPSSPLSAKELVYYADKRVNHDQIVSLTQRLDYIIDRYGHNDLRRHAAIRQNFERCQMIEAEIFRDLDFAPDGLSERMAAIPSTWDEVAAAGEVSGCAVGGCP